LQVVPNTDALNKSFWPISANTYPKVKFMIITWSTQFLESLYSK